MAKSIEILYMKLLLPTDQENQLRISQGFLSTSICLVPGKDVALVPREDVAAWSSSNKD
ncbi:hypothetical protein C5167_013671 [Papaver somniferum]|uniref:Uncharacterized protein n=1 Tax=Papaver somniferum TaxID=3469 RepID=A0A4Y7J515_PAPSO|nr:hypothetical protein C5167_013671 [Papaver somniferum]